MNKVATAAVILLGLVILPLMAWAAEPKGMSAEKMNVSGMPGMCAEHAMIMSRMMGKNIVASNDGGVILLTGNKLIKFDKDLNMVKKVEVDLDLPGMQKMMMDMRDKCPMCKKMMSECQMK